MQNVKRYEEISNFLLSIICFLFVFSIRGQGLCFLADDITIKDYRGNLKEVNPRGGFSIDNIYGSAELRADGGSIKIGEITGDLAAYTTAGDIEVSEARGNVTAVTQGGNIHIKKAHNHVYAQAELGEITVQSAKSVEVQNIFGGDVKLLEISGYSKVKTAGNILLIINKDISRSDICDLSSTEGDIIVYLPENLGADIEIRIPLSEDPKRETHIKSDFSFVEFNQRCLDGKIISLSSSINNGGKKINLYLEKGNVYFRLFNQDRDIGSLMKEVNRES